MATTESGNGESKFGFKNKEKAEETLQILESHDMQYRKLTVRGLLGRAKRVLSMTKAEDKINNIKAAIEVFEKWIEQNGGGTANQNSKTSSEDKVETVPGLGFKDKEAAEQTLRVLEGRDPEYQRLAIKSLIKSSQRVLSGTANEDKIKSIKEAVKILEDFLEKFEIKNLIKNNRAYLAFSVVEQISKAHEPSDKLAKEFIAAYGGPKAQGNYKHLRTMFPAKNDEKSWDIVRNQRLDHLLVHLKTGHSTLFDESGAPTATHIQLIQWAYSPQPDKLKEYLNKKGIKREHEKSKEADSSEDESPKKKQR